MQRPKSQCLVGKKVLRGLTRVWSKRKIFVKWPVIVYRRSNIDNKLLLKSFHSLSSLVMTKTPSLIKLQSGFPEPSFQTSLEIDPLAVFGLPNSVLSKESCEVNLARIPLFLMCPLSNSPFPEPRLTLLLGDI